MTKDRKLKSVITKVNRSNNDKTPQNKKENLNTHKVLSNSTESTDLSGGSSKRKGRSRSLSNSRSKKSRKEFSDDREDEEELDYIDDLSGRNFEFLGKLKNKLGTRSSSDVVTKESLPK